MTVDLIQDRLDRYACESTLQEEQAIREIMQEIALAGLSRGELFRRAAFQGGTCLRTFHRLDRFSEDLDFALSDPDPSFSLTAYLEAVRRELDAYGCGIEIDDRSHPDRAVRAAILKHDPLSDRLRLRYRSPSGPQRKMRIRLEVDTNPPSGARYETRYLDFPFPASVRVFDLKSLFAGKLHALLCREFVKGRDWYDFVWFTARRTSINHDLLTSSLAQSGPWAGASVRTDRDWVVKQMQARIETLDWERVRADVQRFVRPRSVGSLEAWSREFFLAQCDKVV